MGAVLSVSAVIAIVVAAAVAFSAPSFSIGFGTGFADGNCPPLRHAYVKVQGEDKNRPNCCIKKIRTRDYDGRPYVKRVRICG